MKYISYIWTLVLNLIALFVVFAIFDSIYGSFETIAISLLVIIYISIVSIGGGLSQAKMQEVLFMHQEFKKLRKILKEEQSEYEVEFEEEDVKTATAQMKKTKIKFYINAGFNFIIFLIAIFSLLNVL